MKTFMNIIGVLLFAATVALIVTGCTVAPVVSGAEPPPSPAVSEAEPLAIRTLSEQPALIGQVNVGFTGTVDLWWQWPTNGNPAAYAATYAIVQATVDLVNWETLATISYTSTPAYSFNVTNSPRMFFRWRETIPGLY